jgi:hypothetical protein
MKIFLKYLWNLGYFVENRGCILKDMNFPWLGLM